MAQPMLVKAHFGFLEYVGGRTPRTTALYTVRDRGKVTLYKVEEHSDRITNRMSQEIMHPQKARQGTWATFGLAEPGSHGLFFTPRAAPSVDSLSIGPDWDIRSGLPPYAKARFHTRHAGNRVTMGLTVFLTTGPENLVLQFVTGPNIVRFPAKYEWGEAQIVLIARYTTEAAVDKMALDALQGLTKSWKPDKSSR